MPSPYCVLLIKPMFGRYPVVYTPYSKKTFSFAKVSGSLSNQKAFFLVCVKACFFPLNCTKSNVFLFFSIFVTSN